MRPNRTPTARRLLSRAVDCLQYALFYAAFLLGLSASALPAQDQSPPPWTGEVLWRSEVGVGPFNEAVAADVDYDGLPEVIVSHADGRILLLSGADGNVLWKDTLGGSSLLHPVLGFFTGGPAVEIATIRRDGSIVILRANDGTRIAAGAFPGELPQSPTFVLGPSLLPGTPDDLILVDGNQRVWRVGVGQDGGIVNRWRDRFLTIPGHTALQRPVVGTFPSGMGAVYAAGSGNLVMFVLGSGVPSGDVQPLHLGRRYDTSAVLVHDADGIARRCYVSDPFKDIRAVDLSRQGARMTARPLSPGSRRVIVLDPYPPIVSPDITADGVQDIILHGRSQVVLFDGQTGSEIEDAPTYSHAQSDLLPGGATFSDAQGSVWFIVGTTGRSVLALELTNPQAGFASLRLATEGTLTDTAPLVMDGNGDARADVLLQSESGHALLLATELPLASGEVPWPTDRGGPLHTGGVSPMWAADFAERQKAARKSLEEAVGATLTAWEERKTDITIERGLEALSLSPRHAEVGSAYRAAWWRKRMILSAFCGLLFVAVLLVGGWALGRAILGRRLLKRVAEHLEQDNQAAADDAVRRYGRVFSPAPSLIARLAKLARENDWLPLRAVPAFEQVYAKRPGENDVALVLAALYTERKTESENVIPVLERAVRILGESGTAADPAQLAHYEAALGRTLHASGKHEEARSRLESACRRGIRDGETVLALARCYLRLDLARPHHLPVLEGALEHQPEDPELLEGVARCYVAAQRQKDPRAIEVFERLTRICPDSVVGNQEMAAYAYWNGEKELAEAAAGRVLERDGNNPVALQVLAWCYWSRRDLSEDAQAVYSRALRYHPGDSNLLLAASAGILPQERPDAEALAILARAVHANINETEFLKSVADRTSTWLENGLKEAWQPCRSALEGLGRAQALEDQQAALLAQIYADEAVSGPDGLTRVEGVEAEQMVQVLEQALTSHDELKAAKPLLGTALLELGHWDARHEELFVRLIELEPQQSQWPICLARVYMAQERYEAMQELLSKTIDRLPDLQGEKLRDESSAGVTTSASSSVRSQVQRLLAVAHANLKEFAKAQEEYQAVLAQNPEDTEAIVGLAQTYARMDQRTPEIIDAIRRALNHAPDDAQLHLALAQDAANQENWEEATKHFIKVLKAGPEHVEVVLGESAAAANRYSGQRSVPARWMRVQILYQLRRYADLVEETERIASANPAQRNRVLTTLDKIQRHVPEQIDIMHARARWLKRVGKIHEARRLAEEVLRHDKNHQQARRMLAEIYETILQEGENPDLRYAQGEVFLALNDYDRAVEAFQKCRKDKRLEQPARAQLAQCFLRKGMLDMALQEFMNVPMEGPVHQMVYELGREFEKQDNKTGARMAYQQIYAADAAFEDVAERLRILDQVQVSPSGDAETTLVGPIAEATPERYEEVEEIGRGAMAGVYKAYDRELDEMVALKVLPARMLRNAEALRRFRHEARSARRLTHESIVRIHDIGEQGGRKYISMELVDGKTLKQILRDPQSDDPKKRRPLKSDQAIRYASQIVDAMRYAHDQGIIHRDLKPANIMITGEGRVKVADFGISKAMVNAEGDEQTMTGAIVGTPLYMSPEQVLGQTCDRRADIYAFGVLFYEMLAGRPPFQKGDLAYQHLHNAPPDLPQSIPTPLAEIVMRCLEKERDQRWDNFAELGEALQKVSLGR